MTPPESTEPPADWRIMRRAVMSMDDVRTICAYAREQLKATFPREPGDPWGIDIALANIEDALAKAETVTEDDHD